MKVSGTTVLALAVIVAAGAYAAGRATATAHDASASVQTAMATTPPTGHGEGAGLPTGHPPIDDSAPFAPVTTESSLVWKTPANWQSVPNTSSMRLATLRIPHAAGDAEDADVSFTQVGGAIEANAQRWVEQFDSAGQKTAKRSSRKIGGLEVTIIEVEGTYSGGMGRDRREETGWALVGAIVLTPSTPHFIKMTGPVKTVKASRADFDALIASLTSS